jgi:hypothetical protein
MLQIKLAVLLLGGALAFYGYQEHGLATKATQEPIAVDLAELETGARPPSLHVEIGPHWKLWDGLIYSYTTRDEEPSEPGPATELDFVYYPLVSEQHPFMVKWQGLLATYGSFDAVPGEEREPLPQVAMLVRSERFARLGDVPTETWEHGDRLHGLLVNDVRSLGPDARQLLRQSFATLDFDRVLILEEGRRPSSPAATLGMMGGGGILSLLGLASFFVRRR